MKLRHKMYSVIAGTLIILLSVLVLIVWPTFRDIKQLSNEIYEQRISLEKKYVKGQLIKNLRQDYEKISPKITELSKPFIAEGDELKFITDLEKIAAQHDLRQQIELELEKTKTQRKEKIIPLKLGLSGNFISTIKYILDLEKLNYYINIDSLTINKGVGGKSLIPSLPLKEPAPTLGNVDILLTAKTYWKSINEVTRNP